MISVNTLVQPNWQRTPSPVYSFPTGNLMPGYAYSDTFRVLQAPSKNQQTPVYRQWPYRGFAFASDLGLVGYLIKQPLLGSIGWLIAIPYYAYALLQPKDTQGRKEEALYQATANGIFPFIEAKLGVTAGAWAAKKLPGRFAKKYPTSVLHRLPLPMYKGIGGLLALLGLTCTLGDPLSHWLVGKAQTGYQRGNT